MDGIKDHHVKQNKPYLEMQVSHLFFLSFFFKHRVHRIKSHESSRENIREKEEDQEEDGRK